MHGSQDLQKHYKEINIFVYISDNQMQATHQALPQRKSPFKFLMTINDNKIPYQKSPQSLTGWAIFL